MGQLAPSLRPSSEVCAGMPSINGHLFVVVEQPMARGHAHNYAFTQLCCRSVGPLVSTPTDQENRVEASLALPQNRGLGIAPTSSRQREGSRNALDDTDKCKGLDSNGARHTRSTLCG
jgi:hypothetical protein